MAAGTYEPVSGHSFSLKSGVALYGGFSGSETNLSQRNFHGNPPTLAIARTDAAVIDNEGGVIAIDATAILDGFFISQGVSSFAAINNVQASPTIRNCMFDFTGPVAIANVQSSPVIDNCSFRNGESTALYNIASAPIITNSFFAANISTTAAGAIVNQDSSPVIVQCNFTAANNTGAGGRRSPTSGNSSPIHLPRAFFNANTSTADGGAIGDRSTGVTLLTDSLLINNFAKTVGGAIEHSNSTLRIINSTIAYNVAARAGGGLQNDSNTVQILNSIFVGQRRQCSQSRVDARNRANSIHRRNSNHQLHKFKCLARYAGNNNLPLRSAVQ